MNQNKIRPLALCLITRGDAILVFEAYDEIKRETYYRPLGGGIEFGEWGKDTIARELREEIGAEIVNARYLATFENIFVCNGKPGHEIVLLFQAEFADPTFYRRDQFDVIEKGAVVVRAMWKPIRFFRDTRAPLYPDGLLDLITNCQLPITLNEENLR